MTLGGGVPAGYESADPGAAGAAPGGFAAVDHAIEAGAPDALAFLRRLVSVPSVAGREAPAQEIVAAELARLGFAVSEIAIPAETGARSPGGVPQADYAGRPDVLGRLNPGARPALAYGPRARGIHGPDEAVDLASIVTGARVLARFIAQLFADGGLPGGAGALNRRPRDRRDLKAAS